jgi:hypothetical protein
MEQRDIILTRDESLDPADQARQQSRLCARLGLARATPFSPDDVTAGTETELAVTVRGAAGSVDLARAVAGLGEAGGLARAARAALSGWLEAGGAADGWEHSWLRVDRRRLTAGARALLESDLADRDDRADFMADGDRARLPASYVLRLALADALAALRLPAPVQPAAQRVLGCFLNDNTAPEVISTHVVSGGRAGGLGAAVADENAQRFLLVQLLTEYANRHFGFERDGQQLAVYGAPNPPARLRQLGGLLPADSYRELLMNPCLAGFRDGAAKRRYMHLCHETLSRSRQHAHARLHACGIGRAPTVERMVSDTSLLNSGLHLSLGSRALGVAFDGVPAAEKYLGDLVSKIVEHFIPLFIGLYAAAPARLAPEALRPEEALGFLPNELSPAFLRLTWQSWKRKAGLLAGLKGDFLPDARLLDYFAALPGLPGQPSLDGRLGNGERLKAQLAAHGLFSSDMTVYALYRLREQAKMGFSGFEGRYYSLPVSFHGDLAPAAELQRLVTALAYRDAAQGRFTHASIPDDPETESERRQLVFAAAIGLPVAYVRRATRNRFLLAVLEQTRRTRPSKRHGAYYKVYLDDYRSALARLLAAAAPALDGGSGVLEDLRTRIAEPDALGAAGRMTRDILDQAGAAGVFELPAAEFNLAAEHFFRGTLRRRQLAEGVAACARQVGATVAAAGQSGRRELLAALCGLTHGQDPERYVARTAPELLGERARDDVLLAWIGLALANVAAAGEADTPC